MALKKTAKAKKVVKPVAVKKPLVVKDPFNKSAVLNHIVAVTGAAKKQAVAMLDTLTQIIEAHISKKGPGIFVLPGIAKFRIIRKPATKARKGVNPFTGEAMVFAAKPARNVVKIRPLKKVKDIVQ